MASNAENVSIWRRHHAWKPRIHNANFVVTGRTRLYHTLTISQIVVIMTTLLPLAAPEVVLTTTDFRWGKHFQHPFIELPMQTCYKASVHIWTDIMVVTVRTEDVIHWQFLIMTTLLPLAAPEVVLTTTDFRWGIHSQHHFIELPMQTCYKASVHIWTDIMELSFDTSMYYNVIFTGQHLYDICWCPSQ